MPDPNRSTQGPFAPRRWLGGKPHGPEGNAPEPADMSAMGDTYA